MRYLWFAPVLVFLTCQAHTPVGDAEGDAPMNNVLFERPIGDAGQRLAVTRGPYLDPALFKSVRSPHPELKENFYEVRVELQSPEAEPVQLATRLRMEHGTNPDKGSVVLDALVEDAVLVLAMAEGSDLFVWQIVIGHGSTCWTPLRADKLWTLNAAAYRIDNKRVEMKLGRTDDRRLTVKVVEKGSGHHTIYEEAEHGSLQFKAIRQWVETRGK